MKLNIYMLVGCVYIAFVVGMAIADVGEMSGPSKLYTWDLPILIFFFLFAPFLAGYFAGKDK